ncbi:hypothetical protein [Mycolicibacterium mageritense]|uniref:hypothetical protein n=1 Tax=Mycolicibacterium mageritense TaxID=53462 RepID=UPI001E287D83|nr:hypothetical protein [Mycolicibacterium mageritense]GJJ24090.1 hypothetical protein MTY414_77640 [Mycolicibacterium mageritense]
MAAAKPAKGTARKPASTPSQAVRITKLEAELADVSGKLATVTERLDKLTHLIAAAVAQQIQQQVLASPQAQQAIVAQMLGAANAPAAEPPG